MHLVASARERVQIFNGIGLAEVAYNPLDPGLDEVIGGGSAQTRVGFTATGAGATTLRIATGYPGDGVVVAGGAIEHVDEIAITLIPGYAPMCPIPEPTTNVLLLLGLVPLAWRARPPV